MNFIELTPTGGDRKCLVNLDNVTNISESVNSQGKVNYTCVSYNFLDQSGFAYYINFKETLVEIKEKIKKAQKGFTI